MFKDLQKKRITHLYIIIFICVIIISTSLFMMYKYHVEGEKNLPFNISKSVVVSTAQTNKVVLDNGTYKASVLEKNDIYLVIEKNDSYKKEDIIKKITLNNFSINKYSDVGTIKVYRPSKSDKLFEYTEEYLTQTIEYVGARETKFKNETLQIANQGGIIEFSITLEELGNISYDKNENIPRDGSLIKRLGLNLDNIKTEVSFDIIMELESGNKFKTKMKLELPKEDILEKGVSTTENTELGLIFKRI